jgi:hypothetical protein
MKLLVMQLSSTPCHLIPLRSKYSPQHPVLKHPQSMFLRSVRHQVSHPHRLTRGILVLHVVILYVFGQQTRAQNVLD